MNFRDSIFGEPLTCAALKNPCENTKMILPPTTAIATKRSVAMIGATALLEVIFCCFDVMYVILDFVKRKKMLNGSVFKMHYISIHCTFVL